MVGNSSVFPNNHLSQTIYTRVTISLTTSILSPIELHISMFAVCCQSNLLGSRKFTVLQRIFLFKKITKKWILNLSDKQSFVIVNN